MPLHKNLVDEELHVVGYVDSSDPGAVGAGMVWIDTSGGTGAWAMKIRNAADTGWETISSGSSGSGTTEITVSNDSGSAMSKGDLCYISGDSSGVPQVQLADADAVGTATGMLVLIGESIATGSDGQAVVEGIMTGFTGLTAAQTMFVSNTTGGMVGSQPTGSGDIVRVVGYALTTTSVYFKPGASWVELA